MRWRAAMGYSLFRFRGLKIPRFICFRMKLGHTRPRGTPLHLAPHPPPHPEGRFPHPQTHVGDPHLWVRTHQRAYMALGMGGQNGCPAGNLREMGQIPYHGQYQGFPYQTMYLAMSSATITAATGTDTVSNRHRPVLNLVVRDSA
jgi:hypothetical protein